jgi:hypothetical protein
MQQDRRTHDLDGAHELTVQLWPLKYVDHIYPS